MRLTSSFRRRVAVTCGAALGFVLVYEVTILDSRYAARLAMLRETTAPPSPGARLRFSATAYCKGTTTASGVTVRTGIAAADPALLPVGSVVQFDSLPDPHNGIYTVMDTGPTVMGRHVDVYMWNCHDALRFGRRSVGLTVLRLGWNPRASQPGLVDILFRRREQAAPVPLPSQPLRLLDTGGPPAAPPSNPVAAEKKQ